MESKNIVWRPSPTVCRCCFNDGCYKDISTEYFWMGKREIYSEMLTDTLDVSISYSQSGGPNSNSRLICEPCIARLRDASDFKKQVLECEKMFLLQLNPDNDSVPSEELETNESQMKTEEVKIEKLTSVEDFPDSVDFGGTQGEDNVDDDDDLDDEPLTKLASKIPKKEKVDLMDLVDNVKATEKRKSSSKAKSSPAKKAKTKSKTEAAQPSSSGSKVVPKKQKVENDDDGVKASRENCKTILLHSTAYPFRIKSCKFRCLYCYENIEDPDEFRNHFDQEHKTFNVSIAMALLHSSIYIRIDVTNLKCRICDEPFEKFDNFVQHLNGKHGLLDLKADLKVVPYRLEKEKWNCEICSKKQRGLMQLMTHTNSHFLRLICDNCGQRFLSAAGLNKHIKCKHAAHPHVCRACFKGFDTYEAKHAHVRKVKACHPFSCNKCNDRFMYYEARQRHMATEHGEPMKVYNCNECENVYHSRTLLYLHYKVHHSNEHFSCQTCSLKLATRSELNKHTLVHSGIREFDCDICGKSFTRKTSLTSHYKLHAAVKPYVCPICQKGFVNCAKFKHHVQIHCLDTMD